MDGFAKYWNGFVHGTNTGKINLDLKEQGDSPKGVLKFLDDSYGIVVYEIEGTATPEGITFNGKPTIERDDLKQGDIVIECKLTSEGNLRGTWSSTIGTGGTFIAYPFNDDSHVRGNSNIPEQIFTKRVSLGFIQVYKSDIAEIVNFIKKDFVGKQVVVTYQAYNKPERVNYYPDFENATDITALTYLKLFISEPEGKGINRSITIELRAYGMNELIVQGMTESWVLGSSQIVQSYLRKYEDNVRNVVNRFIPAAQLIFLLSIVILMTTMLTLNQKILVGFIAFIILYMTPRLFGYLFPNAVIRVGDGKPNFVRKMIQKGGSWIIALLAVISTWAVDRYATKVLDSIQMFASTLFSSGG